MGQEDTSWAAMKRFLGQAGVIPSILNFDAESVNPKMRAQVNKLINSKPMSFEAAAIANVSRATAPLAAWVKANVRYSEVLLKIGPLREELQALRDKAAHFEQRVDECK
jgi:dynein heavy chain 2